MHVCRVIVATALAALRLISLGAAGPQRVLFIGNSLTAANNLPLMLEAVARQRGEAIACEMIAYPDFSCRSATAWRAAWRRDGGWRSTASGAFPGIALTPRQADVVQHAADEANARVRRP